MPKSGEAGTPPVNPPNPKELQVSLTIPSCPPRTVLLTLALASLLAACRDDPATPTGADPKGRRTSEAAGTGATYETEIPAYYIPPFGHVWMTGVNSLPTGIKLQPGRYRVAVRVEGHLRIESMTYEGWNQVRRPTLEVGPGGVRAYSPTGTDSLRTLRAQVFIVPPFYVQNYPDRGLPAWQRVPLKPDPNYPDGSVYIGEGVYQPQVPVVMILDRIGTDFLDFVALRTGFITGMTSNQRLTVTVTPLPDSVPGQVGVVCKTASGSTTMTRGGDVICSASGFPEGKALDWKFVEDANPNGVVTETRTSADWRGRMVASGTVSVQERGGTLTASTRATITARAWAKFRVREDLQGHGGETAEPHTQDDQPKRLGHLAHAHLPEPPATLDFEQIVEGPNKAYWYLRSFPTELRAVIHMSRAWKSGHPFRQMQHTGPVLDPLGNAVKDAQGNPIRYCRPSDLTQMEAATLRHEREHVAQINAFFQANSPIVDLERAVRHAQNLGGTTFNEYVRGPEVFLRTPTAAYGLGDRRYHHTDEGGKVGLALFPCQLRYYP